MAIHRFLEMKLKWVSTDLKLSSKDFEGFAGSIRTPGLGNACLASLFGAAYYTRITPWITPQTHNPFGVAAPEATIDESIPNVDSDQTMAAPGGLQRSQAYFSLGGLSGSRRSWPRAATRALLPHVGAVEIDPLTEDQTDNEKDEIIQQLTEPSPHLSNAQVTKANLEQ